MGQTRAAVRKGEKWRTKRTRKTGRTAKDARDYLRVKDTFIGLSSRSRLPERFSLFNSSDIRGPVCPVLFIFFSFTRFLHFLFFFFYDAFRRFISNASGRVTICFCNLFTFASQWASQLFFSAVFSHDCTPTSSFYRRQNKEVRRTS